MQTTKITWTEKTWNPITGCKHGCYYCYAKQICNRFKTSFEPAFHPERLQQPLKTKGSKMIFVCSMADLFGHWVPDFWIESVLSIVKQSSHTFQFLTKNPKRLKYFNPWPDNAWVGASAVHQVMLDDAIKHLALVKATVRFLSCEPMLEPMQLSKNNNINWLIIGACTGNKPFMPPREWVLNLTNNAKEQNIPTLYKDNLKWSDPLIEYPTQELSRCTEQIALL